MSFYNNYPRLGREGRYPHGYSWERPTESFSFIVDPNDRTLTRNLRRKSLTGQAAHPISRQISEEKVSIPVDRNDVDYNRQSAFKRVGGNRNATTASRTKNVEIGRQASSATNVGTSTRSNAKRTTRIPVEHYDDGESDLATALHLFSVEESKIRNKTDVSRGQSKTYSPKKYEEHSSSRDDPPSYESSVSKDASAVESQKSETGKAKARQSKSDAYEEHLEEIASQDEFIRKNYNLHRFLIIPDGNCLYRAVAQAVLLDQGQHAILRQLTVDHITEHKEEFREIIEGDVDEFLVAAQLDGEWAGYPEILALSRWLDININITTGGTKSNPNVRTTLHHFPPSHQKDVINESQSKAKGKVGSKYTERQSIWLSWLSSGHYDMLSEKELDNPSYEEWLRSRESRIKSDEEMATKISNEDATDHFHAKHSTMATIDNAKLCANTLPTDADMNKNTAKSKTVKLSPNRSFLYQNRPSHEVAGTNMNEALYSDSTVCSPHQYPTATYRNRSPVAKSPSHSPQHYQNCNTDMDEAIALALQREENQIEESYFA